jgi:hypothetical protein
VKGFGGCRDVLLERLVSRDANFETPERGVSTVLWRSVRLLTTAVHCGDQHGSVAPWLRSLLAWRFSPSTLLLLILPDAALLNNPQFPFDWFPGEGFGESFCDIQQILMRGPGWKPKNCDPSISGGMK